MTEDIAQPAPPAAPVRPLSPGRKLFYAITLAVSCVLLYMLLVMGMRNFHVPTESMVPGLLPRDFLLTFREKEYERGDVVVLYDPMIDESGSFLVKRIVAVAGDRVRIEGGALFLNGAYASEPYLVEPMRYDFLPDGDAVVEYEVPEGDVLVLGDNRNHSEDGSSAEWREGGLYKRPSVPVSSVVGKVYAVYLPWNRIHRVIHFPLRNALGE